MKSDFIKISYKLICKPLLFMLSPETSHTLAVKAGVFLGKYQGTRKLTSWLFNYGNPVLTQQILGMEFKNPVGLSAGFDKNAELTSILPSVGFGFIEVGTVTGEKCEGNSKPRLWRLKKSKSLLVNWGLMNDGCEEIASRLQKTSVEIPLIVSVGKTNCAETVDLQTGISDYLKSYKAMLPHADFIDINISCPNAHGGEPFTASQKLRMLLEEIAKIPTEKPIFLKMPADLPFDQIDEILEIADEFKVAGFICSNLTKSRENPLIKDEIPTELGGLSGKVVEEKANSLIAHIYKKTHGKKVIIGVGGVFSAEDAYKKIKLGASLVQLITGMIYEGPQLVGDINRGLAEMLKRDGFNSLSEAIGFENRP